jgi:hypothetical protein
MCSSHPLEDGRQTVTEKALRREHIFDFGLEEKFLFAVADVIPEHLGKSGVKVDVTIGGIGLQRVLDAPLLAALLADEQRTSVIGYMLLYAQSEKL